MNLTLGIVTSDDAVAHYVRVFVNDIDVTAHCLSADDRHGWAVVYAHNADGMMMVDPNHPDRVLREVITGSVRYETLRAG